MTTHQARAEVSAGIEDRLAELRRLNVRKRFVELLVFPSLWAAGSAMVMIGVGLPWGSVQVALRVAGTVLSAVALNALVLLLHEGMHGTLFRNRTLNRWISVALGACMVMSFTAYRVMHTRHHDYLGDARDPDDYHNYTTNRRLVWALHYVRLLIGVFLYLFLIPIFAFRYGSREERRDITVEYLALFSFYVLAALALPPVLVAYATSTRGLAQHGIADASDPYLASRSIQASRPVAFCLLNENYHLEHHLFPEVPSYNLGRLHLLIGDRIPYMVTGRSYLAFIARFLWATLRLDERPIGLVRQSGR
jgi:fatty acid desaturase